MKKGINRKALILPLLILTILAVNLIMVSAADGFWNSASNYLEGVVLPAGIEQGAGAIFVAIIGILLIFIIIGDMLSLVSPLSDWVNWTIGAGVTLILITMGTARIIMGWVMILVTTIFGVGGAIALVMTAVVFLMSVVLVYFGLGSWIVKVKGRRKILEAQKAGTKSAAETIKAMTTLNAIGKNT